MPVLWMVGSVPEIIAEKGFDTSEDGEILFPIIFISSFSQSYVLFRSLADVGARSSCALDFKVDGANWELFVPFCVKVHVNFNKM
jgi:hypothetical protein